MVVHLLEPPLLIFSVEEHSLKKGLNCKAVSESLEVENNILHISLPLHIKNPIAQLVMENC